jgi:hypothetical protein
MGRRRHRRLLCAEGQQRPAAGIHLCGEGVARIPREIIDPRSSPIEATGRHRPRTHPMKFRKTTRERFPTASSPIDQNHNFSDRQVTTPEEKARNNQEVLALMTAPSTDGVAV